MSSVHTKTKSWRFQIRDGLVRTEGLAEEINLRFKLWTLSKKVIKIQKTNLISFSYLPRPSNWQSMSKISVGEYDFYLSLCVRNLGA